MVSGRLHPKRRPIPFGHLLGDQPRAQQVILFRRAQAGLHSRNRNWRVSLGIIRDLAGSGEKAANFQRKINPMDVARGALHLSLPEVLRQVGDPLAQRLSGPLGVVRIEVDILPLSRAPVGRPRLHREPPYLRGRKPS